MDFYKSKQAIALPPDSEDEKFLKDDKAVDPELGANPPQQECGRRCCARGRKVIRRIGHFLILGAFLYWLCGPSVKFRHGGGHKGPDVQLSDFTEFPYFTELDELSGAVLGDYTLVAFDSDEKLECDQFAEWSEPKKIDHHCGKGHHRKPHPPKESEPPHHPGDPEPPQHPDHPDHPHKPDHPDHPHKPGHPHKPDHPYKPDHPHKPHHPHRPGRPHRGPHGPKYTSDATFKLPLSESALLFYSHGPFAHGGIVFSQDDSDSLKSDEVEVTINAKIWDKAALGLAKVCTLKRDHGAGLGIWTEALEHEKPEEHQKHELAMRISVKFPKHPNTLELEKLQTHMPLFSHFFKEANLKVKDLEVLSFFAPIGAQALHVDRGTVKTENNVVVGNYTATEFLVLETKNSPIIVNVTLSNAPEKKFDGEEDEHTDSSKLFIKTSNSPICGNLSLVANTKDHSGGKFLVHAITTHSPLHIGFADAPVDSILRFTGLTSLFPAVAVMHPTYQGDFLVKSTLFGPKVEVKEDVVDPAGKNRTRTVDISQGGREITGKVFWGSEEESKDAFGHVELGSTLLRAVLKL